MVAVRGRQVLIARTHMHRSLECPGPSRRSVFRAALFCLAAAVTLAGCDGPAGANSDRAPAGPKPVAVTTTTVVERPIVRFIPVTGTLAAQDQADVAAEIAGRVVATPVERGTRVKAGGDLVRIASTEVDAQAQEADANAAQIEARLGLAAGTTFDPERVSEVVSARANQDLAEGDLARVRTLFDKSLVSRAEFDQRRTQTEAMQRQYDVARNGAVQQYEALRAARARVALARKAVADTTVRAPFDGAVEQRLVSVGDYVTRGTKVAVVIRTDPLRLELTVPEQYIAELAIGRTVALEVDAYPGRMFAGHIRYVSPALTPESRALVAEAVVPNGDGALKPGFFATARIEQASAKPSLLVPITALRTTSGSAKLYVVSNDRVEERIVTTGQPAGALVEVTSGLKAGEVVATSNVNQLADGLRVTATQR